MSQVDGHTLRSRATESTEMERVTFRLPDEQFRDIEDRVEDGEYPNRSELLRTAVRELLDDGGDD